MQIGIFGLLTIIFVIAKLAGAVDWSWWVVFLPMIIGATVGFALLIGAAILAAVTR